MKTTINDKATTCAGATGSGPRRSWGAIAHRLGVSEKAIRKLVGASKPADSAQLAFVGITTAAAGKPPASRVPCNIDRR
jgi:hypothetical protein